MPTGTPRSSRFATTNPSLAQRKGVTVGGKPTPEQEGAYAELSAMDPNDFDQAYVDQIVSDHEEGSGSASWRHTVQG